MDYVISKGYHSADVRRAISRHCRSKLDTITLCTENSELSFHAAVSPHSHESTDQYSFLFDGQFSCDREYYHSSFFSGSLSSVYQNLKSHDTFSTGVFCFLSIQKFGHNKFDVKLWTDWLGNYPVYILEASSRLLISSNMSIIAEISGAQRSVWPAVENMFSKGLSDRTTHLAGVRRLPAYSGLEVDSHGNISEFRYAHSHANELISYRDAFGSYRQTLEDHLESALRRIQSVGSRPYILCDLTGGCDSRSVLASLLGRVNSTSIHVRSMGAMPNPDFNVASYFSTQLGLIKGTFPVVNCSEDYGVRLNAALSGGGRAPSGSLSPIAFTNFIHFRGSYGGLSGVSPSLDPLSQAKSQGLELKDAIQILIQRRLRTGACHLLSKDAVSKASADLLASYTELLQEGYVYDNLSIERYARAVSRTQVGLGSYIEGKWRIVPDLLANKWLLLANRAAQVDGMQGKMAIFDLIRSSSHPELAFWPMAIRPWQAIKMSDRELSLLAEMKVVDYSSAPLCAATGPLHEDLPIASSAFDDYSPLCKIDLPHTNTGPQIESLVRNRTVARWLFEQTNETDDLWQCFDRDKIIHELFLKRDEDFRPDGLDVVPLGLFASALIWRHGLEAVLPVESVSHFPLKPG